MKNDSKLEVIKGTETTIILQFMIFNYIKTITFSICWNFFFLNEMLKSKFKRAKQIGGHKFAATVELKSK